MPGSIRRIKLLQAITYFVSRTTYCGKAKLYWLLYLLDFKAYATTTLSITGLEYYATTDGPVPLQLDHELDSPQYDFVEQFHIDNLVLGHGRRLLSLHARAPFDGTVFNDYERSTLRLLATVYATTEARAIDEKAFLPAEPWRTTYDAATREFEPIEYRLALQPSLEVAACASYRAAKPRRVRLG